MLIRIILECYFLMYIEFYILIVGSFIIVGKNKNVKFEVLSLHNDAVGIK